MPSCVCVIRSEYISICTPIPIKLICLNAPEDKTDADKDFVPKPYSGTVAKNKKKESKKKAETPKQEKSVPKPPEAQLQTELDDGQQSLFGEDVA